MALYILMLFFQEMKEKRKHSELPEPNGSEYAITICRNHIVTDTCSVPLQNTSFKGKLFLSDTALIKGY